MLLLHQERSFWTGKCIRHGQIYATQKCEGSVVAAAYSVEPPISLDNMRLYNTELAELIVLY